MRVFLRLTIVVPILMAVALAASKPHVITFGRWTQVRISADLDRSEDLKVRPMYVDGRLKEFTFGIPHDVTEQLFVVRRMIRVNDSLPQEAAATPRWSWQRGGWLIIDRINGHISQAMLPEFDPDWSSASWYRDYVAYCGISDDGRKLSAVVMQLGRRKPILKKPLGEAGSDDASGVCAPPAWQRAPTRVSFVSKPDQKLTFAVRGHMVEIVTDDDAEEGTE
ncbi:MAG TPA: hypothetical protein VK829_10375 [Terriglobales bacterium]|jgi:hypothetical protein|nr:hypothetical protein [Terriglobales bacterium]